MYKKGGIKKPLPSPMGGITFPSRVRNAYSNEIDRNKPLKMLKSHKVKAF